MRFLGWWKASEASLLRIVAIETNAPIEVMDYDDPRILQYLTSSGTRYTYRKPEYCAIVLTREEDLSHFWKVFNNSRGDEQWNS